MFLNITLIFGIMHIVVAMQFFSPIILQHYIYLYYVRFHSCFYVWLIFCTAAVCICVVDFLNHFLLSGAIDGRIVGAKAVKVFFFFLYSLSSECCLIIRSRLTTVSHIFQQFVADSSCAVR